MKGLLDLTEGLLDKLIDMEQKSPQKHDALVMLFEGLLILIPLRFSLKRFARKHRLSKFDQQLYKAVVVGSATVRLLQNDTQRKLRRIEKQLRERS